MSHVIEILTNTVNVAASVAIIVLVILWGRLVRKQGMDVVASRLFLQRRDTVRAGLITLAGLMTFIGSNVLELYGDIYHLDWVVNEVVETVALFVMTAGQIAYVVILRMPSRGPLPVRADIHGVERQ